jgi:hypothetical protein
MQPPGNVGSEPTETSKKSKTGKAVVVTEGTLKLAKASEDLEWRRAEATKMTLVLAVEKPSKLLKVSENLICWKTDTAKVAATEKENKKSQDMVLVSALEKKESSKRKAPSETEKDKEIHIEEKPS